MQTRGGRGDGTGRSGVNGLITEFIGVETRGIFSFDVRREGNFTERIERVADIRDAGKLQTAMAFVICGGDLRDDVSGFSGVVAENYFRADARAFARAQHHPPIVWSIFFKQKNFKLSAGARVDAAKPRGDDARVVEDEDVTGAEMIEQVGKVAVRNFFRFAGQDKEA